MKRLTALLVLTTFMLTACERNDPPTDTIVSPPTPPTPPAQQSSGEKAITGFVLTRADNAGLSTEITGIFAADTIKLEFPKGTNLGSLVPTITFKGKSISPASKTAQNFSAPLSYTVTAEDGTTKAYTIAAKTLAGTTKDITSFTFRKADNPALPGDVTGVIRPDSVLVNMPYGTDITRLVPALTTNGVSVAPAGGIPQNFSAPLTYTVTAEDGSRKSYTVVVRVDPVSATLFMMADWNMGTPGPGKLYAVDANSGAVRWIYTEIKPSAAARGVLFSSGVVYGGLGTDVVAIDTATRSVKWRYTTGELILTCPTLKNGVVYVKSRDSYLYALDAASGQLRWRFKEEYPASTPPGNISTPTVSGGVLYMGSSDNYVYALDAATGAVIWKTYNQYAPGSTFNSSASVVDGVVYIGDVFHNVLALNAADGSIKWVFQEAGSLFHSSPTVVDGVVYIGSADKFLYAIHAATGTLKWKFYTPGQVQASPMVVNGTVYVGSHSDNSDLFYAIDAATGTKKWEYWSRIGFYSAAVANGTVYVSNWDRFLAFDAATGAVKWTLPLDHTYRFISDPCIVDQNNNVYVTGTSGNHN